MQTGNGLDLTVGRAGHVFEVQVRNWAKGPHRFYVSVIGRPAVLASILAELRPIMCRLTGTKRQRAVWRLIRKHQNAGTPDYIRMSAGTPYDPWTVTIQGPDGERFTWTGEAGGKGDAVFRAYTAKGLDYNTAQDWTTLTAEGRNA